MRDINLDGPAAIGRILGMSDKSLYERLGGYDAIAAVTDALMVRIKDDDKLRCFYDHRGADGIEREQRLLIDFLCASSGGPMVHTGGDMTLVHIGDAPRRRRLEARDGAPNRDSGGLPSARTGKRRGVKLSGEPKA